MPLRQIRKMDGNIDMTSTPVPANLRIWLWIHENKLYKAIYNPGERTLTIEDEEGNAIIKHIGVTTKQLRVIQEAFMPHKSQQKNNDQHSPAY